MSMEIFKNIDGYEGYQITSWGRVYSKTTGQFMYLEMTGKGYLRVRLKNDRGWKWHKVHRLVASAFIPNPFGKPQVNHLDGNKQNNSFTNLEWVTNDENRDHAVWMTEQHFGENGDWREYI